MFVQWGERPAAADPLDERDRRVDMAELEQAAHDVQLVGELVGLGAQTLRESLCALEVPQHRLEFGAVAEDRDRPDLAALDAHAVAVHEQHPLAREHRGLRVLTRGDESREFTVEDRVDLRTEHGGGIGDVEEPRGRVVHEHDATLVVDRDEPFAYSVQHRLAGLEHRSDLIGFESVDATADDPSDPCGPDDADHRGDDERGEEPAEAAEEVGAELRLEDADGDLAHDLAVVGENRHLHPP